MLQKEIAAFQHPSRRQSIWQLINTLGPYVGLWVLSYFALQISFWLALPCLILLGGFTIRTFIIFHDCGHGSFFRSQRANRFWGRLTGLLTFTAFRYWSANHARHHATSGNLDRRGQGDVWMMTVDEYLAAPFRRRLWYRLYRHPFMMFILGPLFIMLVTHRVSESRRKPRERHSVQLTNLALVGMAVGMSLLIGWQNYLVIQFVSLWMGLVAGVWLFYVQHQYEDVYWEREDGWDFVTASLEGGSFYRLPRVLQWFTGSIGYHHLHHLNSRIPNYNLERCQQEVPALQSVKPIGLRKSLKALNYRLWDERAGQLVSFRAIKQRRQAA
ncbi:fatty acid desaturase [candidate division GN15 bacterium]|nr:fatty acid desaturase [candidate division GN15 bacterium]